MIEVLRKSSRLIGRERRGPWITVVLLGVVVSVLEAIAALAIFLLFAAISGETAKAKLPVIGGLDQLLPNSTARQRIQILCIGIGVFFVARAAITVLQVYLQFRTAGLEGLRLGVRLLTEYVQRPYVWHQQINSSLILRNINESTETVAKSVFAPIAAIMAEGALLLAMVCVLMVTAPAATAGAALLIGSLVFVLLKVIQPRIGILGQRSQQAIGEGIQAVTETLGGIREVKVAHKEEHFLADFAERRGRFARASFTAGWLGSLPRIAIETMFVLFIVTFLLLSGKDQQSAAGAVPVLGLFAYAVLRMLPSVNRVVQAVTQLRYGIAGLDYIYDDLMTATERAPIPVDQITPLVFADALRLDNVWFRYESSPDWVLQNVDLVLRPGECIGLVGSTGSGKTTLVDVICGLLDPARGVVSVDGQEIGDCLLAWQASLGMVPQSIFLADASIRRNIAFGLGDDQADDGKVHRAIEQAQLLDFVASLPAGIDTMVGEAGVRLSGGQRQRIAIARALYDDPAVLIFDEGTSALDNATERQVLDTLEGLRSSRTMIIVAHRLSTVKTCDRLLLLEKGVITGQGAFDELVESSPDFRRMAH